jgi:hypothetical protein
LASKKDITIKKVTRVRKLHHCIFTLQKRRRKKGKESKE